MTTMTKAEVLRRVRGLASIERAVLTDMANSANSAEQENAALQAVASLAATLAAVEAAFEDAETFRAVLEAAGYENLDELGRRGAELGRKVGETARKRTLQIIEERDSVLHDCEANRRDAENYRQIQGCEQSRVRT